MKTIKYITNYSLWLACALFAVLFTACDGTMKRQR